MEREMTYQPLPKSNPILALKQRGYEYLGYWHPRYVYDVSRVQAKRWFFVTRQAVPGLVKQLQEAGWKDCT